MDNHLRSSPIQVISQTPSSDSQDVVINYVPAQPQTVPESPEEALLKNKGVAIAGMVHALLPRILGKAGMPLGKLGYDIPEEENFAGLVAMYIINNDKNLAAESNVSVDLHDIEGHILTVLQHMVAVRTTLEQLISKRPEMFSIDRSIRTLRMNIFDTPLANGHLPLNDAKHLNSLLR